MKIYDADGTERDWGWVKEKYNLPDINEASREYDHWEVVELRERIGPVAMRIRVIPEPWAGIPILIKWPDDHIVQVTTLLGYTDFVLGAYYRPPKVGPYSVRVSDPLEPSDVVEGLGMLGKSNHAHLEPTFQFVKVEEPEEPPEEECKDCPRYRKALSEIHAIVAEVLG